MYKKINIFNTLNQYSLCKMERDLRMHPQATEVNLEVCTFTRVLHVYQFD